MSFVLKTRLAPAGRHRTVLMGFEEIDGPYSRPALRWTWRVEGGAHEGLELVKVTGTEFRLGTALGDLLEALSGRVSERRRRRRSGGGPGGQVVRRLRRAGPGQRGRRANNQAGLKGVTLPAPPRRSRRGGLFFSLHERT